MDEEGVSQGTEISVFYYYFRRYDYRRRSNDRRDLNGDRFRPIENCGDRGTIAGYLQLSK